MYSCSLLPRPSGLFLSWGIQFAQCKLLLIQNQKLLIECVSNCRYQCWYKLNLGSIMCHPILSRVPSMFWLNFNLRTMSLLRGSYVPSTMSSLAKCYNKRVDLVPLVVTKRWRMRKSSADSVPSQPSTRQFMSPFNLMLDEVIEVMSSPVESENV